MSAWSADLAAVLAACDGARAVVVSVAEVRGSTPREAGAKMTVGADRLLGTIGGGNLEYKALEIARALLVDPGASSTHRRFPLGASLGQCCGGIAVLAFELVGPGVPDWLAPLDAALAARVPIARAVRLDAAGAGRAMLVTARGADGTLGDAGLDGRALGLARETLVGAVGGVSRIVTVDDAPVLVERVRAPGTEIVVFGAGHVGRALVHMLGGLPCRVTWVDSRADAFPREVPANVEAVVEAAPERLAAHGPAGALWVIATHSHPLDFALTAAVLARGDARYCGMIGSLTKRRRLERHLRALGYDDTTIGGLTCPIGIDGIGGPDGKHPGAIAVAVSAQLLRVASASPPVTVGSPSRTQPTRTG